MRKLTLVVLMSLGLVGAAYAQPTNGISVSTDPIKAAAAERHAAELKAGQSAAPVQAAPMKHHHAMHHVSHHTGQKKVHGAANHKVKAVKPAAAVK